MIRSTLRVSVLILAGGLLDAQAPPPVAPVPEAMLRMGPMAGCWSGEGWIRRGPGEPERFKGTETVEPRLGGQVLVVEGRHQDVKDGRLIHHAFAVISYDSVKANYRFRSHLANGMSGDYQAEWKDGAFVWSMEIPRVGTTRYTIRIKDGLWEEVGEMQREGTWTKFFDMRMKRQAD